jgi:hypothetical protein
VLSAGVRYRTIARVTYQELLDLAKRFEDRPLTTVTGKEFTVGIYLDSPVFTPASSGIGQSDGRKAAERFVARFNETGSLRPGDYADVTRNASYFIGLILESRGGR